jgi:hypothetical protein
MGDPTRSVVNTLLIVSLVQLLGAYLCACNIGAVRCIVAACSAAILCFAFRRAMLLEWLVCRPLPNPVGNNDNWQKVAWHESSHGSNCVFILSGHGVILAADCILTGILSLFSAASFNPNEQYLVEMDVSERCSNRQKSD